ncbi:hypothetical protein Sulku_1157 [Sulfuricurvum kujiense DSM 16994]|uniref:Uncharacterized protein n=1 Tax=Sulfuricurvum kujiense (strain ATCC BAA-921 / DSM 16994 / JCM 11577 / YK-1) TaxID=709032 RepID=E4TWX9_SULKY|nr:hypothetical protein [Sulfuricurvum kujiense]ADR33820.1 hypothetical protein Sulku_1157 [Sulfuricurvum kujiense DSM 16994]
MNLYDYIYVDLDKVISLYSQLTGGVVELRETQIEKSASSDNKRNYDFTVFKHDAGGTTQKNEANKETIKPHHSLLQELEQELSSSGFLVDLSQLPNNLTLKDNETRALLKSALCVKCTGRIVIEDYERIKSIGQVFPDITKLINRSHEESLKNTPEYKEIEHKIIELENVNGDKNTKLKKQQEAKELKKLLESLVISSSAIETIPQWILEGMKTWIDAFLPNITNIRVYPFPNETDEHLFGHVDTLNFSIPNSNAFHFTYGSFPTEEFTMLGVITSVPMQTDEDFNPLIEFEKETINDYESVERGFRGMFKGFTGMESMVRTCRYPRVLVHPILVYRQSTPNKTLQKKVTKK